MKCINCDKTIPDVSQVCPYCNNPVDPNQKKVIDFGDINNTAYNSDKFDIKVYVQEPKNKKIVIGALLLIVFIIVGFALLVMSMFVSKDEPNYKVFTRVVDEATEFLEDNFIGSRYSASGNYKMTLKVNNEEVGFDGLYGYDIKNKILNLTGTMKDPKEATGGVLIDTRDLEFTAYLKDDNFYFQSSEIYGSENIYFPLMDETGFLSTKNYDLYSLVIGGSDALTTTLKEMSYQTEKSTINYLGKDINVTKRSLILDNANKLKFIKSFLTYLKEDANFVNEVARLKNKKSDEIINTIENYITTSEYKYSSESPYKTTISIYFQKKYVYRIEFDLDEEEKEKYILDIGENKYYLEYLRNNTSVFNFTFASSIKELDHLTEKKYDITFDSDQYVTDLSLFLEEDKQPKVKRQDIENYKNIKDFGDADYAIVKSNASLYLSDVSFIDRIREKYKEKCTPDLNCVCNPGEATCSCSYNSEIITCDVALVRTP